jgi:uncharacterized protein (TIGR03437 family)
MKKKHLLCLLGAAALFGACAKAQAILNPLPARVLGQLARPHTQQEMATPASLAPNLVEGREFYAPQSVALDATSSPPVLYVADTANNRVLAWRDATALSNGQKADLVIGQKDFTSTAAWGGSTLFSLSAFSSGLRAPSGVAVDASGNLFVADAGNNRILRYPRPFDQQDTAAADLVIGQPDLKSNFPNIGTQGDNGLLNNNPGPSASSIRTNASSTSGVQAASLVFDAEGNLWFTDSGNHRILRYSASDVGGAPNNGDSGASIAANFVLGQPDFTTATPNPGRVSTPTDRINKSSIRFGGPLAFDASGNLYFADDLSRVLVWQPPFDTPGMAAARILGIFVQVKDQPLPGPVNDTSFGSSSSQGVFNGGPQGLWVIDDCLFVSDTINNRIVRFDPMSTWPEESLENGTYSPKMAAVFGQADFTGGTANGGPGWEPSAATFYQPTSAVQWNGNVYLVDSGNSRVLALPYSSENKQLAPAFAVLGQVDFPFRSPNLIEGREFSAGSILVAFSSGQHAVLTLGPGAALDDTGDTPHLYIADTGNNRVLAFRDARQVQVSDLADIVIGQVDRYRSLVNSPINDASTPTATGLATPASVAVDPSGNLWVADTGNGRVLRYPRPFDNPAGPSEPDVVIGQPDFTTAANGDTTRDRLYRPSGIAFTPDGNLLVSDLAQNRVLLFRAPFLAAGQSADLVLGQPDGASNTGGNGTAQLSLPLGVSSDSSGLVYVADTGNNRLQIFGQITSLPETSVIEGADAVLTLPGNIVGQPVGVTVSRRTGAIWVSDLGYSRVLRFPEFNQIAVNPSPAADFYFNTYAPRQILLDANDDVIAVDSANRITMHYPQLQVVNAANAFPRVAPAMMAMLTAPGVVFSAQPATTDPGPLPKVLGDVEVLVAGLPSALQRVGNDIRLVIPKDAPYQGQAEFIVRTASTGQILAHSYVTMTQYSPGVFYAGDNPASSGQARAYNQDGSANNSSHSANKDEELTVCLTGYGAIDGLPDDGQAGSAIPIGDVRAYLIGTAAVEAQVLDSATDPNEPGVWRVKIKVPQVLTNGNYVFAVIYRNVGSTLYNGKSVRPTVSVNK